MRKIISALLCIVISMLLLVGCGEDPIGEYIDKYEEPKQKEKISINLYIIHEEGTDENAIVTVRQRIADYTTDKFLTTVNVQYVSADKYEETIYEKVNAKTGMADIFLVTSKEMMYDMLDEDIPADLTDYFESKKYGTLNASIADALIQKTLISVEDEMKYYCVPNNRVIGTYEYVLINKNIAKSYYIGSQEQLSYYNSYERLEELKEIMGADYDNAVKIVDEMYNYTEEGYACNILTYPTVTEDYAFESVFVINKATKDVERAMEILYAINNDKELHNYLTYGIPGTNYIIDDETGYVNRIESLESNSNYLINPLYTGNIFLSLYCEDLNWTEEAAIKGERQNLESVAD